MSAPASRPMHDSDDGITLTDVYHTLRPRIWKIVGTAIATGAVAYCITLLIPPTFTARTTIISPQTQQNSAAAALASLGTLAGIAGGGIKSPTDQYIAILQSITIGNRIVDAFKLIDLYESKYREDALKHLTENTHITAGKKDNLITVEVDDHDPQRAAQMANAYVDNLRWLTNQLALTEAQQRRVFFETHLQQTKTALQSAQIQLQKTGFTAGALKSEPKAAAEAYGRTRAEIAAAEVRLGAMRRTLTETAPEIQQQVAGLNALRAQLTQLEQPMDSSGNQDYVSAYRDFKYQEALFDIFAKQFELAKLDEAREGALIQVLDPATPPELRSKPKRAVVSAGAAIFSALLFAGVVLVRVMRSKT